jgi:YggT family protein
MMTIVIVLFSLYEMVIVVRVILSWVRADAGNPIVQWLDRLTEPVLEPVRRLLPVQQGGFDFSPLIVLFILELIEQVIVQSLF